MVRQATVCQARPKAAAAATVTASPATEPASASRELTPSQDPEQHNRRDASTSYSNGNGSSSAGRTNGSDSAAPPVGPRNTVRLTKAHRPGARQLPDSLRAGVGMAGVPVDGANRTVRMRRVPRHQQQQQQQEQQRQRGGSLMDNSGGVSVIDWDAVDWETDVQLREEEAQQVRQVRCVASCSLTAYSACRTACIAVLG